MVELSVALLIGMPAMTRLQIHVNTIISRPYKTYTFKLCPAVRPFKPPYARRTHSLSDYILTGYGPMQRWLPQLLLSVENGPPEVTKVGKFRIDCVGSVRIQLCRFCKV